MISKPHHFHIPVMGIGYTVDTPVKVAHLGIDSVISLVDDTLIEKMRSFHCRKEQLPYKPIPIKTQDYRAKRISEYLNVLNEISKTKFNKLLSDKYELGTELYKYVSLLPEDSTIKSLIRLYNEMKTDDTESLDSLIKKQLVMGAIDVNIMSKGDTVRYKNSREKLPAEFNDAHAAVRGFFKSNLTNSTLIISAGLNPKLFTFVGTFPEVLPDDNGVFHKKIAIKVSDYRSALVQGKFLAQRGVWVSEYRIESGLNCGGHAFATKGNFLGPILEEFYQKRNELEQQQRELYIKALTDKKIKVHTPPPILFSAQGGVGTHEEATFLKEKYQLSSIGWGSPFLLVPEVVNIDNETLELISEADENSIYLSDTSPFGIPFYTVKGNTKDQEKLFRIKHNIPGSTCPKRFVALNTEFGEPALCTASKEYQKRKIDHIKTEFADDAKQKRMIDKVTAKTCICVGLGTSALLVNGLERKVEGNSVSICPGPNMAYFTEKATLAEMVDHIYGRTNLIKRTNRPHIFLKEIQLYLSYIKTHLTNNPDEDSEKQRIYLEDFRANMLDGINYYQQIILEAVSIPINSKDQLLNQLATIRTELEFRQGEYPVNQFA